MSEITRRSIFLDEIGLGPLWLRRDDSLPDAGQDDMAATIPQQAFAPAIDVSVAESETLNHAAVSAWGDGDAATESSLVAPVATVPAASPAAMDWRQLQKAVAECTACGLCRGRKNTVFGVGDSKAKWLFIGEGPGRNEDIQGEPFVGPAGKLLDNILLAMGLKRGENAYIANIVKCRPTDSTGRDRPPAADEVAACLPYLQRQIELIQPTILVALGKTAALSLLGLDPATPVSKLRGTVHRYADRPLVVTYHPAYLLRQLADKSKVWSDLCLAMSTYANVDK